MELLRENFARVCPGRAFFATAEPTGGEIGRLIRRALQNSPALLPETLAALFAADRNEHLFAPGGLRERCLRGELAACDRYVLSSLAYQGLECGEDLPRRLNSAFPAPALIVFFDLDPRLALRRIGDRRSLDIFENLEFQLKVRRRFLDLLAECRGAGVAVRTVDAAGTPEKVAGDVWRAVSQMPIFGEGVTQCAEDTFP